MTLARPQDQLYSEAIAALEALEQQCHAMLAAGSASAGPVYLLGDKPSSLDAIALGAVWLLRSFPGVPQDLAECMTQCPHLCQYIDRMAASVFAEAAPPAPADRHYHGETPNRGKGPKTKAEVAHWRGNVLWGVGAVALLGVYAMLGGVLALPIALDPAVFEGVGEDDDDDLEDDDDDDGLHEHEEDE